MSEATGRVLVVGAVLAVSLVVTLWLKRRSAGPFRRLRNTGLAPGIYFFSSVACAECSPVRARLVDKLGADGFIEYRWEQDREVLEDLEIDAVPATLVVDESGDAKLWPGSVESMFSIVDP